VSGIIIILLSVPWLLRTYHYYPDARTFLSWGTTLTFAKMNYFVVSNDLKELGGQNNPDLGNDIDLFPAGIKESFDKTYNGYYEMQTVKVKKAILKIDPYYFYKKPLKLFILSLKTFTYTTIIEFKHEEVFLNPVKIKFIQILGVIFGLLFFTGIVSGAYKFYYLFIGNLSYLILFFFIFPSNYQRHYLPCYPFYIFSVVLGGILLYKITNRVLLTIKSKNQ
jgi:hypothetical protein